MKESAWIIFRNQVKKVTLSDTETNQTRVVYIDNSIVTLVDKSNIYKTEDEARLALLFLRGLAI